MIFDHRVKFNGVLYEKGEDVPIEKENGFKAEDKAEVFEEPVQPKRRGRQRKE